MLKLRYYQEDAVRDFNNYAANNHEKNPLIVMPTGSGKSLVIATIIKDVLKYDNTRVLVLTHQKELIVQNMNEFIDLTAEDGLIDVGVYSAGLKKRDTEHRVLFAGIQSVHKRAYELGFFNLILIDECHRVPVKSEGTYRHFLKDEKRINKKIVVAGLSATPYRLKGGLLCDESHEERVFHEVCHETTMTELMDANHVKNRDKVQYLCPLISKNSIHRADMSEVKKTGGEYNLQDMERAFDKADLITCSVNEIQQLASDRNKILVFTTGIKHCEDVARAMEEIGITTGYIHSQLPEQQNAETIQKFKDGYLKSLVNVDILTTGFNEKAIDCIAMLRSTMSPGLYVQIAGRGCRLHPSKQNCLFLDFGGNILAHGPIDKIEIRKNKTGGSEVGTAPMKECPQCHNAIFAGCIICPECGYKYPEEAPKHDKTASNEDILSSWKKPEIVDVLNVCYSRHEKPGKRPSLRVDYHFNKYNGYHSEWVCLEHDGYAREKALKWVQKRLKEGITVDCCPTIEQMLEHSNVLKDPKQIIVDLNDRFPKITGYIF